MRNIDILQTQIQHAMQQQDWGRSIALLQQVLQEDPQDVSSALTLSTCLQHLDLLDEAVVIAKNALAIATPSISEQNKKNDEISAQAKLQLANLYLNQDRHSEAGSTFSTLLEHPKFDIPAAIGLSQVWLKEGYPTRALELLAPRYVEAADYPGLVQALALAYFHAGNAPLALETMMSSAAALSTAGGLSNALMFTNYISDSEQIELRLALQVKQVFPAPIKSSPNLYTNANEHKRELSSSSRIRVGWVSADLYAHPVGYFLSSFLPHLQAQDIDCLLYSNGRRNDVWTTRLTQSAQRLTSIHGMSTDEACALISKDTPDILIDLSGHTEGHRLDIFAKRACRIQASYLGYFSSTFLPSMDWLITDRIHLPANEVTSYTEKIAYLSPSRFCFTPPPDAPLSNDQPCLRNGYITWGAFVNLAKISDACLKQWASVLKAVPNSRLKLRWKHLADANICQSIRERFGQYDITPGRIEFHNEIRHADLMYAYHEIDMVLDTWPFSGATSSCEALWMGVPVLTFLAERAAGRQTASILQALGYYEWVAQTEEQFVDVARNLANDVERLMLIRARLREEMSNSPLINGEAFAHEFAKLLRELLSQN